MKFIVYLPIANEEVVFEGSMTEILERLSKAIKAEAYKSIEDVEACLVALKPEKGHKRLNNLYCDCLSAYRRHYVRKRG